MSNPWGLSPAQARALSAVIETGSRKGAARKLDLSAKTIEAHVSAARFKMRSEGQVAHLLTWDRWRRSLTAAPDAARYAWLRHGDNDESLILRPGALSRLPRDAALDVACDEGIARDSAALWATT